MRGSRVIRGAGISGIYALGAASGRLLWSVDRGSFVSVPSAMIAGNLVIMAGTRPDALYAVDADVGTLAWETPLPAYSSSAGDCAPAAAKDAVPMIEGDIVHTGSPVTKTAYALRLRDGAILWRRRLSRMKAAPTSEGRHLFFPLGNGSIAALDKASGKLANTYRVSNGGFGPQNAVIVD